MFTDNGLSLLAYVLSLKPAGIAMEFGVAEGRSLRLIAAHMPVVGFDSFRGLPEDWRDGFPAGMFACPMPQVAGAVIVPGLFEDTLPKWQWDDGVGLVHIDCDLYSSTVTVLRHVMPHLSPGVYVVFDEFHGYPGAEDHESRAWREYVERNGVDYEVVGSGVEQFAVRLK